MEPLRMEAAAQNPNINDRQSRRRNTVSTAELFSVLEALLPFAKAEIETLLGFAESFPNDPDCVGDTERARRGKEALELAERLIERKTKTVARKQKTLRKADA